MRNPTRQLLEETRARLRVIPLVLKWVGVALLVVECLLAVYLGTLLLAESVVWATYS